MAYHHAMPDDPQKEFRAQLFNGLTALASSFPKTCINCGRVYQTAEQFLLQTASVRPTHSGLKEAIEADGLRCVEVFRNCSCGSTLMDVFANRRDSSAASTEHRKRFETLLALLVSNGLEHSAARNALLKLLHGEHSEELARLIPQHKTI